MYLQLTIYIKYQINISNHEKNIETDFSSKQSDIFLFDFILNLAFVSFIYI
jgi:hypothetical protein